MASEPDRLSLTPRERQVLAELEAALHRDAPDLEASLTLRRRRGSSLRAPFAAALSALHRRLDARLTSAPPAMQFLTALALVIAGSALLLLTFATWLPVALAGVAVQAAGIWVALHASLGLWSRRRSAPG